MTTNSETQSFCSAGGTGSPGPAGGHQGHRHRRRGHRPASGHATGRHRHSTAATRGFRRGRSLQRHDPRLSGRQTSVNPRSRPPRPPSGNSIRRSPWSASKTAIGREWRSARRSSARWIRSMPARPSGAPRAPRCRFWCDGRMLAEVIRVLAVDEHVRPRPLSHDAFRPGRSPGRPLHGPQHDLRRQHRRGNDGPPVHPLAARSSGGSGYLAQSSGRRVGRLPETTCGRMLDPRSFLHRPTRTRLCVGCLLSPLEFRRTSYESVPTRPRRGPGHGRITRYHPPHGLQHRGSRVGALRPGAVPTASPGRRLG